MKNQGTSSVWAIHGNFTKSGKPILSANTHFNLGVPSTLHISELSYDSKSIIGLAFPGTPVYITGQTKFMAWSPTSVDIKTQNSSLSNDVSCIFKEQITDNKYLRNITWIPLSIEHELISVKDAKNYSLEIHLTDHGPLLKHIANYSWEWVPNLHRTGNQMGKPLFCTYYEYNFIRTLSYLIINARIFL